MSGKTTTAHLLQGALTKSGIPTTLLTESAARSPMQSWKLRWEFLFWTSTDTIRRMLEAENDGRWKLGIVDRGPFDFLAWLRWFESHNQIPPKTARVLAELIQERRWTANVDVVLLDCSVGSAIGRRGGEGVIVNRRILGDLAGSYESLGNQEKLWRPRTIHISTETASPRAVADLAMNFITEGAFDD